MPDPQGAAPHRIAPASNATVDFRPAEFTWVRVRSATRGTDDDAAGDVADLADGRPVRVDLGGVASRYIGETEKNLSWLFARLAGTEVVLTFDEADALFGRRSGDPPPDP